MFLDIEPHPVGLPDKEWRKHLDAFLITNELNPDILPHMSYQQMVVVKEIHKSFNRIKRKHGEKSKGESNKD